MGNSPAVGQKTLLFILPSTAMGGAETRFHTLIRELTDFRAILLTQESVAPYFEDLGIPIYHFDAYGGLSSSPMALRSILGYVRAIRDVVQKEPIDGLFGVMHFGTLYAALAKDLFFLPQPIMGSILGHLSGYFESFGRRPSFLEKGLIRYLLWRSRVLVVSSQGVKEDLVNTFGAREGSVQVIPNGIDLEKVKRLAKEPWPIPTPFSGKTITMVSRLCSGKDFWTLLNALALLVPRLPVRLVLVGEGDFREEIVQMARQLGIESHVVMVGFQSNPYPFILSADVFVLSSLHEGFGNVLVEAMALGVPVVSTDCPTGPRTIIEEGVSGLLVKMGDSEDMTRAIRLLLEDKALAETLAKGGLQRAKRFESARMTKDYESLFHTLLGE